MRPQAFALLLASCALALGCGPPPAPADPAATHPHSRAPAHAAARPASSTQADLEARLAEVAHIHGGAGPWAVAGYRMGEHALRTLALPRGSFELEVQHFAPREVQYSCIADGAAASTGASLGKLNLSLTETAAAETHTQYRNKSTGRSITLRVTPAFSQRFSNVPRAELSRAGREVMGLSDEDIFEVVP